MNIQGVMQQVNSNLSNLTEEEQFLIATCTENILNGSHWGFMPKALLDYYKNPLEYNNQLTSVHKVSNGKGGYVYLVEARDAQTALKTLQKAAPVLVDKPFVDKYLSKLDDVHKNFVNFVKKSKGTTSRLYLGVNSINSTPSMTYKGERHKAIQIPLGSVISHLGNALGDAVFLYSNSAGGLVPIKQIPNHFKGISDLFEDLVVSDGTTSAVLPIVIKG